MGRTIIYKPFQINFRFNKAGIWIKIIVCAIGLSIIQDYIYSQFRNTGFYLSESLLYNSIWVFLFPLTLLHLRLMNYFGFKRKIKKLGISILMSGTITLFHIFIFSAFFVMVSYVVFSPTHNFLHIFQAALSNQFYVLALFYLCFPLVGGIPKNEIQSRRLTKETVEKINVKIGLKTISLNVETIEFISTNKPYSVINLEGREYLDNRTLQDFQDVLDPILFVRVHRSILLNKNFVKEFISRQNGDYDCRLESGNVVRFSRHYRKGWQDLLQ